MKELVQVTASNPDSRLDLEGVNADGDIVDDIVGDLDDEEYDEGLDWAAVVQELAEYDSGKAFSISDEEDSSRA